MFKSLSKFMVRSSLVAPMICASLLALTPLSAAAGDRIGRRPLKSDRGYRSAPEGLRVQHIFLGKIVYGKTRVVHSAEDLEKLIFRWATDDPDVAGGLCFASRKPEFVFGNLIGSKKVTLGPNTNSTLFSVNLAKLSGGGQMSPGKYYFRVWLQDADKKFTGEVSNVVVVEYKSP